VIRKAELSACGQYRWWLQRSWGDGASLVACCLNPSMADAVVDDPTLRRLVAFAQRDGYGSLEVVNLFAWRAVRPSELGSVVDPVGPEADRWIAASVARAGRVVAAWGAPGDRYAHRVGAVVALLGEPLWCLGTTLSGQPRHPLYVPGATPLIPWVRGSAVAKPSASVATEVDSNTST